MRPTFFGSRTTTRPPKKTMSKRSSSYSFVSPTAQSQKRARITRAQNQQAAAGFPVTAGGGARPMGNPGRNIIRFQQTHVGGEVKSVDVVGPLGTNVVALFPMNTTPTIVALNLITPGSSAWNRIGRKCSMKSIHFQGWLQDTASQYAQPSFGRIMIVYDKQPNGSLPTIQDILLSQANSAADSNVSSLYSGLNLNNKERFEVIMDRRMALPAYNTNTAAITGISPSCTVDYQHINVFHRLGNRETHYKADSSPGVIGDIATGSLFLVSFGNVPSGSEPYALSGTFRLRYTDL